MIARPPDTEGECGEAHGIPSPILFSVCHCCSLLHVMRGLLLNVDNLAGRRRAATGLP